MAIAESNTTKTLADGDGSSFLCSKPASSKTLVDGSVQFCAGFATNNNQCLNNDNGVVFTKQVVEIEEENEVETIGSNSALNAVEVSGSFTSGKESEKIHRCEDSNFLSAQNGAVFGSKFTEISGSISNVGEKCYLTEEKGHKTEINTAEKGDEMVDEDCQYVVGDFVWGKIRNLFRNYSWWPGRIYDPSDASDYAAKYKREDHSLLVAYFGDGSFSWCQSSQLKPFVKNFEEMSKQSGSKSFVNAVQEALDEMGWVVGSKMACSCVPQENRMGTRPVNAGVRPGVLVPEGNIGKEYIELLHEPAELVARVRNVAPLASIDSLLEVTILKSWLTEFNRAKGKYPLPIYHEPKYIEGLEHNKSSGVKAGSDVFKPMNVWIQIPFEVDGDSSPINTENGDVKCEKANNDTLSREPKRKKVSCVEDDNIEGNEESARSFSPRKIKRSRYLSPPYMQLLEELDIEDEIIEKFDKNSRSSVKLYPNMKEVLSEVRSAALSPFYLRGNIHFDMIKRTIFQFKSLMFFNGSNYKMYNHSHASKPIEPKSQLGENQMNKLKKMDTEGNRFSSKLFDDEGRQLGYIRWKLEKMVSMIEDSGAGISMEMKSELEGEMKSLLEVVRRMIDRV